MGPCLDQGVTSPEWRCLGLCTPFTFSPSLLAPSLPLSLFPFLLSFPSALYLSCLCFILRDLQKKGKYSKELRLFSVPNTELQLEWGPAEAGGLGRDCGSTANASCLFFCHLQPEVGASCCFGALPWETVCRLRWALCLWLGRGMLSCWLHPDGCCSSSLFCPPGRASLHDKASLRLEQVRSEDQGWYECKVLMLDQQYDTFHNGSWVHLTINGTYGPPSRGWGQLESPLSEGLH